MLSEFVFALVPGSNPNHTIYAFIVKICSIFVIMIRKRTKIKNKEAETIVNAVKTQVMAKI